MDSQKNFAQPEAKLHFLDYWRVIRIRKAIIITVFLITSIIATAVTFILPESYASTCKIKVENDVNDSAGGYAPTPSQTTYDPYFIQTTFEIMSSSLVLSNVINTLNLNVEWGKKYFNGETLKTTETMGILKSRMSLAPVRSTKLISITVYSDDPKEAALLANTIAEAYKNYRMDTRRETTSKGISVLEAQYLDESNRIQAAQLQIENLRRDLGITVDQADSAGFTSSLTTEQLQTLHAQMIEGERAYKEQAVQLAQLKSFDNNRLRDVLPNVVNDAALSELLAKMHEAEQSIATKKIDYPADNLNVTRIQTLIDTLNRQVDARIVGILSSLESQVSSKKAALDALTQSVEDAKAKDMSESSKNQPYYDAKRNLEQLRSLHNLLYSKIEAEKLDAEIPKSSMVQMTDRAEPGKVPVKPNRTVNIVLGLVFGLIMGIGLAFFIEYLDTSVKTIDDVERTFQAPVLGVIPQNIGYLLDEGSESKHAEAYRVLRTNLLFSRKEETLNTIVIVSAGAGEGKSTTAINLATVFAQAGSRVLIVDSDLRRPTLHKLFKVTNNLGLTNYLLKQNTLAEIVQTTGVPNLDFMASGKLPNSSIGILGSTQMKQMISELKQRYDFIFFDSPPILGVSDASIIASEVDVVMQVIQYRRYPQPMTVRAKQMIEKVGGNFVGIILNNINMSQDEGYYYYSGYYQDYYYSRNPDEQADEAKTATTVAKLNPESSGDTEIKQKI
ncbi:MAG: polysaccharide biosynthesis tyrosine autokinase [Verrucomicrobiae bacterium]